MHKSTAFSPIRALSNALDLLMKAPLPLWVGGLVLVFVQGLAQGGAQVQIDPDDAPDQMLWALLPFVAFGLCFSLVIAMVTSWLRVGYYGGVRTVMRAGDVEFGELYRATNRWLAVFLTVLLQGLVSVLALLPGIALAGAVVLNAKKDGVEDLALPILVLAASALYLPVFLYFSLGFSLMVYPAALDGAGPVESLQRSWQLASGIRLQLLLMGLLSAALAFVGILLCCIGLIPASILVEVMWCEAYVQATREQDGGWWIDHRGDAEPPSGGDGWREWDPVEGGPRSGGPSAAPSGPVGLGGDSSNEGSERPGFDPSAWRKDP